MVCSYFAASRCLHGPYLHTERVVARQKSLRSAGSVSHGTVAPPTRQPWPCHVVIGHPIIHGRRKLLPFAVRIKLRCIGLLSLPVGHAAANQNSDNRARAPPRPPDKLSGHNGAQDTRSLALHSGGARSVTITSRLTPGLRTGHAKQCVAPQKQSSVHTRHM